MIYNMSIFVKIKFFRFFYGHSIVLFYTFSLLHNNMQKNQRKNIFPLSNKPKCDFINYYYSSMEKYFFFDFFAYYCVK